jgi:hypothetical protein
MLINLRILSATKIAEFTFFCYNKVLSNINKLFKAEHFIDNFLINFYQ